MHEGHFTEQIVDGIIHELKAYPGRRPKSLKVKVGETYHLVEESVLMHYQVITKGTPLEGVLLEIIEEPMEVFCAACLKRGPVEDHHMLLCSFCHSRNVRAVAGNKVTIENIELEPL